MKDVAEPPDDERALSIMTTEHFTLQTARSAATAESTARVGMYLTTVSATLVALAFVAQLSRLGVAFLGFALVAFPAVFVLGLATFERTLQLSIEDVNLAQRINRVRRFYLRVAPHLRDHISAPATEDHAAIVLRSLGMRPGWWQMLLSVPGMVGVVNSVLLGATAGVIVGFVASSALAASVIGVVIAAARATCSISSSAGFMLPGHFRPARNPTVIPRRARVAAS